MPTQPRFAAVYLDNPKPVYPALTLRLGEQGLAVAIDAAPQAYWNGVVVSRDELALHLKKAALRAERGASDEKIAEARSAAARAGVSRIGFVTEPRP